MKRVICICAALIVAITPAFAWNAESFVSDGLDTFQVYEYDDVVSLDTPMLMSSRPMMFSAGTYAASDSSSYSLADLFEVASFQYSTGYGLVEYTIPATSYTPSMTGYASVSPSSLSFYKGASGYNWGWFYTSSMPNTYDGYDVDSYAFPWFFSNGPGSFGDLQLPYYISFDVSSLGSFNSFSLSGSFSHYIASFVRSGSTETDRIDMLPSYMEVVANGQVMDTFYLDNSGYFNLSDRIYTLSTEVTSLYFRFYYSSAVSRPVSDGSTFRTYFITNDNRNDFLFSILSGNTSVIDGFNDEAQNNINEHEALESQWTGSMTSNFNALNLDDFTIPDGLVSGFALISGIFNDLWNGMGEFKIVYVFPLTLGVVLLLIGRISKFSGGHGSAKRGRSDDNA